MKDFKGGKFAGNRDRGGARPSFGGDRPRFGGGSSFRGSDRGGFGGRDNRPEQQMHSATCDGCGNSCEVPFRPTGDKPVYCRDCFKGTPFDQSKNHARTGESVPRTVSFKPEIQVKDSRIDDLKKQVDFLHSKLDRVLHAVELMARTSLGAVIADTKSESGAAKPKKTAAKKTTTKVEKELASKKKVVAKKK